MRLPYGGRPFGVMNTEDVRVGQYVRITLSGAVGAGRVVEIPDGAPGIVVLRDDGHEVAVEPADLDLDGRYAQPVEVSR